VYSGAPCFLSVDEGNQYLFSSNYFGGNVAVFPIEQSTGELLPMCQEISFDITLDPHLSFNRDSGHCHQTVHLERSKNILLCELGQNAVYTFEFQPQPGCKDHHEVLKQLNCWVAPPGSGPRHLVVHPSEEFVYVLSELSCTIIVLRMDPATGVITSQCALQNPTDQEPLQCHSTLREDERDSPPEEINSAEILLSPDSRFLYVSNRDVVVPCYNPIHNTEYGRKSRCSIAVFAVLDGGARVQLIQHVSPMGRHPRALTFLNRGSHLAVANKDEGYQSTKEGGNLVLFPIAPNTGLLTFDQAVVSEDICGITLTQPTWIHPLSHPI
jgi:6-phosphogluconolactonase